MNDNKIDDQINNLEKNTGISCNGLRSWNNHNKDLLKFVEELEKTALENEECFDKDYIKTIKG